MGLWTTCASDEVDEGASYASEADCASGNQCLDCGSNARCVPDSKAAHQRACKCDPAPWAYVTLHVDFA